MSTSTTTNAKHFPLLISHNIEVFRLTLAKSESELLFTQTIGKEKFGKGVSIPTNLMNHEIIVLLEGFRDTAGGWKCIHSKQFSSALILNKISNLELTF